MTRLLAVMTMVLAALQAQAATLVWKGDVPSALESLQLPQTDSRIPDSTSIDYVRRFVSARGHFWPEFEQRGETLLVAAGPVAELGGVRIVNSECEECVHAFRDGSGERASTEAVTKGMEAIVEALVGEGKPFAQVRVVAIDVRYRPQANIALAVYPGPEVFAGSLQTGSRRTPPDVFEREVNWQRGAPLDGERIEQSADAVAALPFVSDADTARLIAVGVDTADLLIRVQETPGIHVDGVLGYVPESGSSASYWAGELNLDLLSPFGGGRTVHLHAARRDPDSRRTYFSFWQPRPFNAPVHLGLSLRQDDFGTDFIDTRIGLGVRTASIGPEWQLDLEAGRVSTEEEPSPETFPGSRYSVGVGVADSSGRGSYQFMLTWSYQRLKDRAGTPPPQDAVNLTQGRFAAHRWVPLSRSLRMRFLSAGAGTLVSSAFISSDQLFRVGGIHSLRGYREEQFLLRDYLRLGWEGHVGDRRQSIFAFVEAAWLNFVDQSDRVQGSAGLGVRLVRRLEFLVAVPSDGGFAETKIHIGITTGR